ncbi:MAG: hypothetical protein GXY91_01655 [Clostridia bacterium]|nr:hypothetical protein [Clostridia bacterium]
MSSNRENLVMLTEEERRYLYQYFKSKDISCVKKKKVTERVLDMVKQNLKQLNIKGVGRWM